MQTENKTHREKETERGKDKDIEKERLTTINIDWKYRLLKRNVYWTYGWILNNNNNNRSHKKVD